ncbi:hypothetical protein JCM10449v2_002020 [Rhodotorula kratochvilovae]
MSGPPPFVLDIFHQAAPSAPHSRHPSTLHVRRTSIGPHTPDVILELDAPVDYFASSPASVHTASPELVGYGSPLTDAGGMSEKDPLRGPGDRRDSAGSFVGWREKKIASRRQVLLRRVVATLALLGIGAGAFFAGQAVGGGRRGAPRGGGGSQDAVHSMKTSERLCNPYHQHGVLNVNLNVPSENMWEPIDAPEDCQPVDFLSLIRQAQHSNEDFPELDFVRNRTVVIFGDSVDRDHVEHMCEQVDGQLEMIGDQHPFSPPYPPGQEFPPADHNLTGDGRWPNFEQSRPFVCHVASLNFRFLSVFHYGFEDQTDFITYHPHFYPPARLEDRFDQIVLPLVASLSGHYGTSPIPSLVSLAPGFWSLLRQSASDASAAEARAKAEAQDPAAVAHAVQQRVWRAMPRELRAWNERRLEEALRHVARAWSSARTQPRILWRAHHFVKETPKVPYTRLVALDHIGRAVAARLVREGRAAEERARGWAAWARGRGERYLRLPGTGAREAQAGEAQDDGLGRRLKIDEWGSLMLGQGMYFRDEVHPLPLPGSYLYGNMLLHQLWETVVEEEAGRVRLAREER